MAGSALSRWWCACCMGHLAGRHERLVHQHKRRVFAELGLRMGDRLVDVGAGAGANLPYVPAGVRYTAVEPNPCMHKHLRRRADAAGVEMELLRADGAAMPLADGSADAVVATLLLCSVADPSAVLRDIRRVLRPGGRFGFVEHVAAQPGTWLRRVQRGVRPVWRTLGDGCEPDRETGRVLREAGFSALRMEDVRVRLPVIGPHLVGWAEK